MTMERLLIKAAVHEECLSFICCMFVDVKARHEFNTVLSGGKHWDLSTCESTQIKDLWWKREVEGGGSTCSFVVLIRIAPDNMSVCVCVACVTFPWQSHYCGFQTLLSSGISAVLHRVAVRNQMWWYEGIRNKREWFYSKPLQSFKGSWQSGCASRCTDDVTNMCISSEKRQALTVRALSSQTKEWKETLAASAKSTYLTLH